MLNASRGPRACHVLVYPPRTFLHPCMLVISSTTAIRTKLRRTFLGTLTTSFSVFYGFRALMGLTLTSFQVTGLACVKDMFYFHEHARKIGIWVALFIVSPYISPLFGNFILAGTDNNWRAVFWMVFGTCCLDLVLIVLFADETFYNRSIPRDQQPARGSRIMRVLGVWQIKNHRGYFSSFGLCARRLFTVLFNPIMIPVMVYL